MNEKGIEFKNELVAKAKELSERAENATFQEINDLKRKWRKASSEDESLAEKELNDEFDKFIQVCFWYIHENWPEYPKCKYSIKREKNDWIYMNPTILKLYLTYKRNKKGGSK